MLIKLDYIPFAGIAEAIQRGKDSYDSLDPFSDIDPMMAMPSLSDKQRFASSDEIVDNGYQRYGHEDDANGGEDWFLPGTEDRNVFDLFDDEEE